jgi:lipid-binding SYLF domain-containing protein
MLMRKGGVIMSRSQRHLFGGLLCIMCLVLFSPLANGGLFSGEDKSKEEEQAEVRKMRDEVLADAYKEKPELKSRIKKAAGYGVFSNLGINVLLLSTAHGSGVVVDNATGKETFMKMGSVGAGVGLGVKDFRAVFIFYDKKVLKDFVEKGLELGGQADAAAKSDEKGGSTELAVSVQTGMEIYQFTESGLALQATIQGTKYWKDKDLN